MADMLIPWRRKFSGKTWASPYVIKFRKVLMGLAWRHGRGSAEWSSSAYCDATDLIPSPEVLWFFDSPAKSAHIHKDQTLRVILTTGALTQTYLINFLARCCHPSSGTGNNLVLLGLTSGLVMYIHANGKREKWLLLGERLRSLTLNFVNFWFTLNSRSLFFRTSCQFIKIVCSVLGSDSVMVLTDFLRTGKSNSAFISSALSL